MCGLNAIFAYHNAAPQPEEAELLATRDRMAARGPDGAGAWWNSDRRLGLGHRRLAIIDPEPRAAQPMLSNCGRFAIVFNGEIYNFRELRDELLSRGVKLRTNSDTEVVLELFAMHGTDSLCRLVGMFAIAIWDDQERVLWLARDSYGIKPLYVADDGWTLRVASQVKAILAGGRVSREPEPAGLVGFMLWGAVPEPLTLYQDIRALPPGHFVRIDSMGPARARPFLQLPGLYSVKETIQPQERTVREAVLASVKRHLEADVPVGLFLSSGIDSAALLASLDLIEPGRAEATTAITIAFGEFKGRDVDETPLAAELAKQYGARHTIRIVNEAEFVDDLPHLFDAMDQPSIDGVNTWFVSKAAAEAGLKVALSGLGGDELFAGYHTFRDIPRWLRLLTIPSHVPGLGAFWQKIAGRLAKNGNAHPKLAGLVRHGGSWSGAYMLRRGLMLPHELQGFVEEEVVRKGLARLAALDPIGQLLNGAPMEPVPRVSLMESGLYMRNQLLRDADWASMAHSIEIRTPFVDVELLRAIRPMQNGFEGKDILARALGIPDSVRHRPKTGFTTPIARWMARTVCAGPQHEPWARSWARHVVANSQPPSSSDPAALVAA